MNEVLYCLTKHENKGHILSLLKREYFDNPEIYDYIVELIRDGKSFDENLIKTKFGIDLQPVNEENYEEYIKILREKYFNRKIQNLTRKIGTQAFSEDQFLDYISKFIDEIRIDNHSNLYSTSEITDEVYEHINREEELLPEINYGIEYLDELVKGIDRGGYAIVAARPSMGKSAFAAHVALHNALKGFTTAFFSLEMPYKDIYLRWLGDFLNTEIYKLKILKRQSPKLQSKVKEALEIIKSAPLFIDTTSNLSINNIHSSLQKIKLNQNIDVVVVDYVQLMTGEGQNDNSRVAQLSRSLKGVAMKYNCAVIACSQLSRACEGRDNKRPLLSDLRDSGCISKDTSILMQDGSYHKVEELLKTNWYGKKIVSMGSNLKLVDDRIINIFSTGTKPIYKVTLKNGSHIKTTKNHPFFTLKGWTKLENIEKGDKVATIRNCATNLQDCLLQDISSSDLFWDEIKEVEYTGEEEVYDITTEKTHNFIANNIILHNSLEQDIDQAIILYRDSYYTGKKETDRILEAIVRKNRNGEIGKVMIDYDRKSQHFGTIKQSSQLWNIAQKFKYED